MWCMDSISKHGIVHATRVKRFRRVGGTRTCHALKAGKDCGKVQIAAMQALRSSDLGGGCWVMGYTCAATNHRRTLMPTGVIPEAAV